MIFAKKTKNNNWRLCIDYQKFNDTMIKNHIFFIKHLRITKSFSRNQNLHKDGSLWNL